MVWHDSNKRVILWGVSIEENVLKAELAFFDSNLGRQDIVIADGHGQSYRIRLPDEVLNSDFCGKSQNCVLEILP